MKLYLVDYWVPFPQSEHGGLLVVAATDRTELANVLNTYEPGYEGEVQQAVNEAEYIGIAHLGHAHIVRSFRT